MGKDVSYITLLKGKKYFAINIYSNGGERGKQEAWREEILFSC